MSGESDSTISLKTDDIDWTRVAIAPRERNMRWFTRPRKIEPASRCNAPFRYLDITLCISFRAALLECFVPASCPRENNCIIRGGIEHRVFNRVPHFYIQSSMYAVIICRNISCSEWARQYKLISWNNACCKSITCVNNNNNNILTKR